HWPPDGLQDRTRRKPNPGRSDRMNNVTAPVPAVEAPPLLASRPRLSTKLLRVVFFPVKFLIGMIFCQGLPGSILVVGWTYRLAQRSVFKYWWTRSHHPEKGQTFADFLSQNPSTAALHHWPNWFLKQRAALVAPKSDEGGSR